MSANHDPALHLIPAPVVVVGVAADGTSGGLTAAWVTRVSTQPPMVAVAVAPERFTHGLLDAAGSFTLSVLGEDQVEVGRLFGLNSRRDVDKWAETDSVEMVADGAGPAPALARCAARLLCRTTGRLEAGDHEIFVGEVVASEVVAGGPALPMRGRDWIP